MQRLALLVLLLIVGYSTPTKQDDSGHIVKNFLNFARRSLKQLYDSSYKKVMPHPSDSAEDRILKDLYHLGFGLFKSWDQEFFRSFFNFLYGKFSSAGLLSFNSSDTVAERAFKIVIHFIVESIKQNPPLSKVDYKYQLLQPSNKNIEDHEIDEDTAFKNLMRDLINLFSTYSDLLAPRSSDDILLKEAKKLILIGQKWIIKKFQEGFDEWSRVEGGNNQFRELVFGQGSTDAGDKNQEESMEADEQVILSELLPRLLS